MSALVGAYFLTDEAYGVSIARGARTFRYLLGTELSLFAVWNVATLAGALLGGVIPDPERLGVDFVFPIAFLALLVPLLRRRVDVAVAVVAGADGVGASRSGCRAACPSSARVCPVRCSERG